MTADSDQYDANPYQSPAWPEEPDAGVLENTIQIQGMLPLDDVLRNYGLIRGALGLVWWYVGLLVSTLLFGFGCFLFCTLAASEESAGLYVIGAAYAVGGLVPVVLFLTQLKATRWIKQLSREQRGIFAYREATITSEAIETRTAHTAWETSWTDYAGYWMERNTVRLYLHRKGLKRRRSQWGAEEWLARFGVNLQRIDIFSRTHFADDSDWERFRSAVKHKLRWL